MLFPFYYSLILAPYAHSFTLTYITRSLSLLFLILVSHEFSSANFPCAAAVAAAVAVVGSMRTLSCTTIIHTKTDKFNQTTQNIVASVVVKNVKPSDVTNSNDYQERKFSEQEREKDREKDPRNENKRISEHLTISCFIFISHWLNNRDRSHTTENKNMGIMLRESDKFSASSLLYCVRNACEFTPSVFHLLTHSLTHTHLFIFVALSFIMRKRQKVRKRTRAKAATKTIISVSTQKCEQQW